MLFKFIFSLGDFAYNMESVSKREKVANNLNKTLITKFTPNELLLPNQTVELNLRVEVGRTLIYSDRAICQLLHERSLD